MSRPEETSSLILSNPATRFGLSPETNAGLESDTSPGSEDLLLGAQIGDVVIEELLAEGGMGRVYRGKQQHPPRPVAVKFTRYGRSRGIAERFHREVELLGRLTHPHIAQIYTAGQCRLGLDTLPYYVLEYVPDAESLTGFCRRRDLPITARLQLFLSACDAIAYGHRQGIVHRDLKPSNLLVSAAAQSLATDQPALKVIDFGIAKALSPEDGPSDFTETGQFLGTRQYMSPEQFGGDPEAVDTRCDVYSLGVVLFELLTGELPYDLSTRSLVETAKIVQEQTPLSLRATHVSGARHLKRGLQQILNRCLGKTPAARYATAGALADDVRRLLAGHPLAAGPQQATSWMPLWLARPQARRRMVSVVIALVITASVGSGVLFISGGRPPFVGGARSTTADSVKPILAGYTSSISSGRTTPVEWLEMYFTTPLQETLTTDNFRITRDGEPLDTSGILIEHNPGGTTDNWILSNLGLLNAREGEYVLEFIEPPGGLHDTNGRRYSEVAAMSWKMPPFTTYRFNLLDEAWDAHVVSMDGLERYTEQTANVATTFIRPTVVGQEGTIVMRFPADFSIEAASLVAGLSTWTTGDAFPYDPGAWALLDVSRDGETWTNVITRGPNVGPPPGAPWDITETVRGSREVWVRARLTGTKEWPDDGITFSQFLRTDPDATRETFRLDLTGPHPPLVPDSNNPPPVETPASDDVTSAS